MLLEDPIVGIGAMLSALVFFGAFFFGGLFEWKDSERPAHDVPTAPGQLERGKIVVHYADGRILKGYSHDFFSNKLLFHLFPAAGEAPVPVRIKDLKAIFFVRDFDGDPGHVERKHFYGGWHGRKVEVTFADGEVLVGSTVGYNLRRPGFFLIPADPKCNNLKVFAAAPAVISVRFL